LLGVCQIGSNKWALTNTPHASSEILVMNSTMRRLLIATALIEAATGLALLAWPSLLATILLDSSLNDPAGLTIARVAGVALLTLGFACWLARVEEQSRAGIGLITAMSLYNIAVVAVFVAARYSSGLFGIAYWPVVVLHTGMAVWCISCIRGKWSTVEG
jgi:hypothetical protein